MQLCSAEDFTNAPVSSQTEECLFCHEMINPGLVADWRKSRHARMTPAQALKLESAARRMSATEVPESMREVAVGCYECHALNTKDHKDAFEHGGYTINVIVSPRDCQTCHPTEVEQYSGSKKAHAVGNLVKNPVFHTMVQTATAVATAEEGQLVHGASSMGTQLQTCLACHGSEVKVDGMKTLDLGDGEEMEVPNLLNWPNHGVGRINPDGSRGACTACHPRHSFSIEIARKPFTCAQCHLAPDTPAWEVYRESKHGNIMLSVGHEWNWEAVPWTVGRDFTAPTCATCHNSLLVDADGEEIVPRTHDFGARLWVRIFGLPYAHPQPKNGATHVIRNADGQPLPTTFAGAPAEGFLLTAAEQKERRLLMRKVCMGCHGSDYADRHFAALDHAVKESNRMTRTATELLEYAWEHKLADPANPFDELIEQKWVQHWLFYATSIRYGAAMGGPDYTTFKNGWWQLQVNQREIESKLKQLQQEQRRERRRQRSRAQ